jgi:predicted Na+-dependent transporter
VEQAAHAAAMATLVCIMVSVGLSMSGPFSALARRLRRADLGWAALLNFLWVPCLAALLAGFVREEHPGLAVALLLFGCLPAGPISLLFVSRRPEALTRSTAIVLALQFASVVLSPVLLLGLGWLVLRAAPLGSPVAGLVSLAAQIIALELIPIGVGTWLRRRVPTRAVELARTVRGLGSIFLIVAALGFGVSFSAVLASDTLLTGVAAFLLLSLGAWAGALAQPRGDRLDTAQIVGLRNISLALVVAASLGPEAQAVMPVLVGAAVTTLLAPVLRLSGARQRELRAARAG